MQVKYLPLRTAVSQGVDGMDTRYPPRIQSIQRV
jgi:hypothetical protein